MTESKKRLRITAGILLLVLAVLSLAMSAYSLWLVYSASGYMSQYLRQSCLSVASGALSIVVAILILSRKFTAAGIVKCFVLGLAILVNLLNLLSLITNATAAIGPLLSGFTEFAGWAAAIFMIIGLFMHSRKSKPLCIVGAILALAASLGQQTFSIIRYVTRADFSKLISGLSFSAAISLTTACVAAAAWILLGVYFGAQNTEQE
ncbi:MAG: hypothetical protein IIZ49_06040 [Oscillospiraceae bacterium]|nr:hypothetical protein [Oscillospiraceae bacterium]